jgi:ABC-type nitrate/sulfonate/bicarbonate transport system substrate-binding protein
MKKITKAILCGGVALCTALSFTACGGNGNDGNEAVTLVSVNASQVGTDDSFDYFVLPEPAASTKTGAIEALNFAGDLQQLYGGEDGYPQAVIVAKSSFISNYNYVTDFLSAVERSTQWIADESTSSQTIVSVVQSHLTEGMTATFNAKNLTKQVIANCGVKLTSAANSKQAILDFMQKLNSVSETSFGTPSDNFFFDGSVGTQSYEGSVSVYMPDGAPALGLAKLLAGEEEIAARAEFHVVDATTIQTYVTGTSPKADICVLPVNLATKLLGNGQNYKLIGTLTHGNLYMVSTNGQAITADNISDLKGKRVGVVNLAQVPGLTFKLILKNNNIDYVVEE